MAKYTFVADGEPSFYGVYKDGNWFAKIQFNGEITVSHEEVFLAMMANTAATLDAMKSLANDIVSMQAEDPNWFGDFSEFEETPNGALIEWPNLAISVENLQKAIFNLDTDRQIEGELTKQVLISGKKAQVILTDDLDNVLLKAQGRDLDLAINQLHVPGYPKDKK